jgi:hypothetical protein
LAAKKTAAAAAEARPDPLATLADELGAIEKELAPFAGKIKRQEAIRKDIRAKAPDSQDQIVGERFVVELGERGLETTADFPALVKKIGAEAFAKFATAKLKALHANVKPGILAFFLKSERTGPRSLKVLEKGQVA